MLSTSQKEAVLRKSGLGVLRFPTRRLPVQERFLERRVRGPLEEIEDAAEHVRAVADWRRGIDMQYEAKLAKRAPSTDRN